ncbi:MAG: hypothetical protein PVI27_11645 [Desulfobacteraceae bacterium]|jgi:hypothetical protein
MSEQRNTGSPVERRTEPRQLTEDYHSVEFRLLGLEAVYQFKIWDMSCKGMCLLVKEESEVLNHLAVGDILEMRYCPAGPWGDARRMRTEIRHISRDEKGRFKGHLLVGLSICEA